MCARLSIYVCVAPSNLRRDKFLQSEQAKDPDALVDINVLLTFNKLRQITTELADVAAVCRMHPSLTVED